MIEDIELECVECGTTFVFFREQQENLKKLFNEGKIPKVYPPKRCSKCRFERKQAIEASRKGPLKEAVGNYERSRGHRFEGDEELIKELNH